MVTSAAQLLRRLGDATTNGRRQPVPPVGQTWTGWRLWCVDGLDLVSPYAPRDNQGRRIAWTDGALVARCLLLSSKHGRAPASNCDCGIRGMPLPDLIDAMTLSTGLRWDSIVDQLGAVGQVELSGRIVRAADDDPRAALRASHARVLELHLAPRLARLADRIAEQYVVPVHVGTPTLETPCPR